MKSLLLIFLSSLLISCGENSENNPTEINYYKNIKPILDAKCNNCHKEGGIAPFALDNFKTVYKYRNSIKEAVEKRTMPPWQADPDVGEFKYNISLNQKQIDLISSWVKKGSLEGDSKNFGDPIKADLPKLSRVDLSLKMPKKYKPTKLLSDYRCFVLDWPNKTTKYVTGFDVIPGNKKIVHHVVIFLAQPQNAKKVMEYENSEKEPGYRCFGGITPEGETPVPINNVGGWAPGADGIDFPEGVGIEIKPGSKLVLQMHYTILKEGAEDQTKISLKIEDKVEKKAVYLPWFNLNWGLVKESMKIPSGKKEVTHEFISTIKESSVYNLLANGLDLSSGMKTYSANPHMHLLGKKVEMWIERDGKNIPIFKISNFDYKWQREYVYKNPILIKEKDKLGIRCTWDNDKASQPVIDGKRADPRDVYWGEGTFDEMCVLNIFVAAP